MHILHIQIEKMVISTTLMPSTKVIGAVLCNSLACIFIMALMFAFFFSEETLYDVFVCPALEKHICVLLQEVCLTSGVFTLLAEITNKCLDNYTTQQEIDGLEETPKL